MALLAEEIVEEWLNRTGHFTIRGIKLGVAEIDLIAVRFPRDASPVCRHIEVQASMRPVSYISRIPKSDQRLGIAANSAKMRSNELLGRGMDEWITNKFRHPKKIKLFRALFPSEWTSELVLNKIKDQREVALIQSHGIIVHRLREIVAAMGNPTHVIEKAAGADLMDLIGLGEFLRLATPPDSIQQ